MSVLSKFLVDVCGMVTHKANCYEMVHTWNQDCNGAVTDTFKDSWMFSFKTYFAIYTLNGLFSSRDLRSIDWSRILTDTLRSSFFLTFNVLAYLWLMCRIRSALGCFTVPTLGFVNGVLSSLLAIMIENRKRRPLLALYLTNLASETAYRQLVNHGYLRSIPNGTYIIFAAGLSGLTYLYQKSKLRGSSKKLLELMLPVDEVNEPLDERSLLFLYEPLCKFLLQLRQKYNKHPHCSHPNSCVSRCVEAFGRSFIITLGWSLALLTFSSGSSLWRNPLCCFHKSQLLKQFSLPFSFSTMALLYQGIICILTRIFKRRIIAAPAISAACSGAFMLFNPNLSIAMWVFWKCVEAFCHAYGKKLFIPYGDVVLYALATGYVAWNATIEPHNIRQGYWKFLVGLTGRRIEMLNRSLYDVFGYRSSKKFPNFKPILDSRYTTSIVYM